MERTVFLGTYTHGESKGIYSCRFNSEDGMLTDLRLAAETPSPSFLALHPNGRVLYAVNETREFEGKASGSITAFAITNASTGELRKLNTVSSHGADPCHLAVTPGGESVVIANYTGGTVAVIELREDGALGATRQVIRHEGSSINKARQEGPHPHATTIDPAGKFLMVADLGIDQVISYRITPGGELERAGSTKVTAGAGPRHFAFRPDGEFAYVINELSRTVTAFRYDAAGGSLEEIQTISTVPEGWTEGSTAELFAHPAGRFLYGSNRGHDSIAVYRIDPGKGTLTLVEIEKTGGQTPRSFGLAPGGGHLLAANQGSGDVHAFSVDATTGSLDPAAGRLEVPAPVCVLVLG